MIPDGEGEAAPASWAHGHHHCRATRRRRRPVAVGADARTGPAAADPAQQRRPRAGGVAGGIAEYFAVDPLLVRLGFVVASFLGGVGVVAYIVAWIVLPSAEPTIPVAPRRNVDTRQLLGFGLVALGLAVIPGTFGFGFGGRAFWPVALIAIGVAVLWLRSRDAQGRPPPDGPRRRRSAVDDSTADACRRRRRSRPPPRRRRRSPSGGCGARRPDGTDRLVSLGRGAPHARRGRSRISPRSR